MGFHVEFKAILSFFFLLFRQGVFYFIFFIVTHPLYNVFKQNLKKTRCSLIYSQ